MIRMGRRLLQEVTAAGLGVDAYVDKDVEVTEVAPSWYWFALEVSLDTDAYLSPMYESNFCKRFRYINMLNRAWNTLRA